MTIKKIDCTFLVVSSSKKTYQNLSETYSAIEPPTWALLLAQSTRAAGFEVSILDANAERLNEEEIYVRLNNLNPKIICLVTYGQNVNTGTTIMSGATYISNYLKDKNIKQKICVIGSHVQALPKETLEKEKSLDFVFTNEGVYALQNVLKLNNFNEEDLKNIKGVAYRQKDNSIKINPPDIPGKIIAIIATIDEKNK